MNFNNTSQPTNPMEHETRYHYLYGRHRQYGVVLAGAAYPSGSRRRTIPFFPKGTPITQVDEGPQTVEQLITDGYFAVPAGEPETAILHDRKHTAWLGLDDILGQVRHRQEIHEQNIHEIEWAQCYAFNEMARGGWPYSEEQRCAFEKRSQELHAQQRDERVALWRDLSKLRLLVPESAQQYLSAFRRTEILDDCEGDLL